ncbi:MAG: PVC-type heme-binding CxxCH protein [Bacteroidota bacterium]
MPGKYCAPLLFMFTVFVVSCKTQEEKVKKDLLATFSLPSEFQLELFAVEPLVADPVDMEIDEEGRVYVAEMHGYPLDTEGSGKIKILKDTNDDGYPDASITFADNLILPTSIMRWKKGLLVTDAPDVIYLEDTTGDDVADIKKVMLTGFARSNPQHNLNSPLYGLDNWIYLGHESSVHTVQFENLFGDKGKEIRYTDDLQAPTLPQNANGRGTRFKPETHQLEMLSSRTQYGHSFDSYGRYFLVNNSNHIYQEIIPQHYLERNPDLLGIPTMAFIPEHGNAAEVYPATSHAEHQLLTDVGVFTSACGITIYQGALFPDQYNQVSFVAEPVHNLVHVDKVENNRPAQKATRMFEGKEFLTSTDPWFRPVNFYVGPDGALYVIDYYRKIIEHPEWMSDEVNNSGELYEGTDKGRIYRIMPKQKKTPDFIGKKLLDKSKAANLVKNLANPNYWWRINAQRLLVDTKPASAVQLLENVINQSLIEVEQIHALWTLQGMDALRNEILLKAISTNNTGLLLNALRIGENRMNDPRIEDALINLPSKDEEILFQLLLSLGNSTNPKAIERRRSLLLNHVDNTWMQIAALTARDLNTVDLWDDLASHFSSEEIPSGVNDLFNRLGTLMVRKGNQEKIRVILNQALVVNTQHKQILLATLQGVISGPDYKAKDELRDKLRSHIPKILDAFVFAQEGNEYDTWKLFLLFLGQSTNPSDMLAGTNKLSLISKDKNNTPEKRSSALEVLAVLNPNYAGVNYADFVHPQQPAKLQITALQILSKQKMQDIQFSGFIVNNWKNFTPEVRDESVNLMLENNIRIAVLLDAVEKGSISATAIGWGRSVHLMTNEDVSLKNKARKLLDQFKLDKEKILEKFEGVENVSGDLIKGKHVFETSCAVCHQVDTKWGKDFGPDLSSIKNQSKRSILAQILEPNKAIADGYELWAVKTKSGNSFEGIIAAESSNAIILKTAVGERITIGLEDITEITSSSLSAMPEGLGNQITSEEMINLLEFLKNFNQIYSP